MRLICACFFENSLLYLFQFFNWVSFWSAAPIFELATLLSHVPFTSIILLDFTCYLIDVFVKITLSCTNSQSSFSLWKITFNFLPKLSFNLFNHIIPFRFNIIDSVSYFRQNVVLFLFYDLCRKNWFSIIF